MGRRSHSAEEMGHWPGWSPGGARGWRPGHSGRVEVRARRPGGWRLGRGGHAGRGRGFRVSAWRVGGAYGQRPGAHDRVGVKSPRFVFL
jgi:hypothetical protein